MTTSNTVRKGNHYSLTINELKNGEQTGRAIDFEFSDREDLFKLVENLKAGSGLTPELSTRLAVSLRLLGPMMMENRKHPLFIDFMPSFKTFMHNLKQTVKNAIKGE